MLEFAVTMWDADEDEPWAFRVSAENVEAARAQCSTFGMEPLAITEIPCAPVGVAA